MSKWTNLLLMAIVLVTVSSAKADPSNIFTKTEKWGAAASYCVYAHGRCNPDAMESELLTECYSAGFSQCTTIVKKQLETDSGNDPFFCGWWEKGVCIVTVKGSN
jgi:hypothetical protein